MGCACFDKGSVMGWAGGKGMACNKEHRDVMSQVTWLGDVRAEDSRPGLIEHMSVEHQPPTL